MKIIPLVENLVVLRDSDGQQAKTGNNLLRLMMCNEPFGSFILVCLSDSFGFRKAKGAIAIPQKWELADLKGKFNVVRYTDTIPVTLSHRNPARENSWICISDGRFLTKADNQCICETLANSKADVLAVNVTPQLRASYEKVLTASQNELVGFRLFYEDSAQPVPVPDDWPHRLFVRAGALNNLLVEGGLPLAFSELLELLHSKSLVVQGVNVGGSVLDLDAENDLLKLVQYRLDSSDYRTDYSQGSRGVDFTISDSARLFGRILLGKGVNIGENSVIVGPTILGNDVKIGRDVVVRASVIGPGMIVQTSELVEEKVLTNLNGAALKADGVDTGLKRRIDRQDSVRSNFREWPKFSYAAFTKRILDIAASVIVLVLFAPVLPVIMLVIKLTSPGPVFFKDTRQGLNGRLFECLKFRTMQVGAHRMQDRLRVLSKVDGPQFMIPDDPRMSAVGRFLRDTYIDEIPQFVNVLLGQMSVVGPRPSPESENRLCPFWRDARLSVRPGITGLWQICRTRQPMKDFQEWIHYDIKYVRDLSMKLDLWVSWQTVRKIAAKFISQF
jgi:lipopolysaccharide/colanic/teichoic acid biosynthesis glycosyltransferase